MWIPIHRKTRVTGGRLAVNAAIGMLAFYGCCDVADATSIGDAAPPFSLATAGGETISLADLRGRVVYVDFWASWCGPCRRSFPWMNEMQQRYGSSGLKIVAINVDKQHADAERFLQVNAARFPVVFDIAGNMPLAYSVQGMPSSYLIDARGTVVLVEQGFRDDRKAEIEKQIQSLLANP
jgi:cytochrome c biogenesis protein CcmG, thiol:disulfide interchange protein DsbE